MSMLSFIHLSDIHFQKYSGDAYDLDADLRNELLIDLSKNFPKSISNANGILICGDIAFSAQKRSSCRLRFFGTGMPTSFPGPIYGFLRTWQS